MTCPPELELYSLENQYKFTAQSVSRCLCPVKEKDHLFLLLVSGDGRNMSAILDEYCGSIFWVSFVSFCFKEFLIFTFQVLNDNTVRFHYLRQCNILQRYCKIHNHRKERPNYILTLSKKERKIN